MKRFISNKFTLFFLGIIFAIMLWAFASLLFDRNGTIFPSPLLTFERFGKVLVESYTYQCLGYTFLRMLIGFAISFIIALFVGVLAGNHQSIYQFLKPLMTVIKSVPTVALVFIFIVLVAPKDAPILVVCVVCFPILYEGVVGGIKSVDKQLIQASQVDGASYIRRIIYIKLPLSIPYIIVSMVSSFALSFKIEIMAEVITGYTRNGLGSVIHFVQVDDPTNMSMVFAYSLLAIILMLLVTLFEEVIKQLVKKNTIVGSTIIDN